MSTSPKADTNTSDPAVDSILGEDLVCLSNHHFHVVLVPRLRTTTSSVYDYIHTCVLPVLRVRALHPRR
jgi:hypothetical protein